MSLSLQYCTVQHTTEQMLTVLQVYYLHMTMTNRKYPTNVEKYQLQESWSKTIWGRNCKLRNDTGAWDCNTSPGIKLHGEEFMQGVYNFLNWVTRGIQGMQRNEQSWIQKLLLKSIDMCLYYCKHFSCQHHCLLCIFGYACVVLFNTEALNIPIFIIQTFIIGVQRSNIHYPFIMIFSM